jgi:hypothetical protein
MYAQPRMPTVPIKWQDGKLHLLRLKDNQSKTNIRMIRLSETSWRKNCQKV